MTLDHCARFNSVDFICQSEKESSPTERVKGNVPSVSSLTATYKRGPSFSRRRLLSIHPRCLLTFTQNPNATYRPPLLFHGTQNPSGGQPILNPGNHANGNPLASSWLHGLGFSQSVPCITLQLRTNRFLVSTLFKGQREDALAVEPGLSHKPQSSFLSLPSVGITIMCHGGKTSQQGRLMSLVLVEVPS